MKKLLPKLPTIILGLLTLLVSLGQLEKVSFFWGKIFIHDFLMTAVVAGSVVMIGPFRRYLWQKIQTLPWVAKFFLGWVVIGLIWLVFQGHTQLAPFFYLARLICYGLFGWWLEYQVQQKKLTKKVILQAFLVAGCLIAYFGWLQYLLLPDTRFLFWLGWDDHYYRLISTLLDPSFTGLLFVLSLVALFRLMVNRWQPIYLTVLGLLFSALLFTYSRSSYVSFGVVMIGVAAWQASLKNWKQALIGILSVPLLCLAILLLPKTTGEGNNLTRTSTIMARQVTAQTAINQFTTQNWLLGNGMFVTPKSAVNAEYAVANHAVITDNWVLFLLQGTGLVGTGLALGWLFSCCSRSWRKNPWLVIGSLAILVHGLFNASLVYPFVVLWALSFRFMGFEVIREKK